MGRKKLGSPRLSLLFWWACGFLDRPTGARGRAHSVDTPYRPAYNRTVDLITQEQGRIMVQNQEIVTIPVAKSADIVRDLLERAGLTADDARIVTDALVDAELTNRKGHGFARAPGIEKRAAGAGSDNITIASDTGTTVALDCGAALGYLAAYRAATIVRERLDDVPLVAVVCRDTSHAGAIGYYVRLVADAGHCAIATAHCSPMIVPEGGLHGVFGTNPIALACPGPQHPLVADLSPGLTTFGNLMNARHAGEQLPEGVAVGPDGAPTRDPVEALEGGGILPAGGVKGSALAFLVQVLSGPVCGADAVPDPGTNYGFFLMGFRTDAFGAGDVFTREIGHLEKAMHAAGARCPGERSEEYRQRCLREGIQVPKDLWDTILGL
ncbi:MAG: Ldh family oxidoreductase [bacterium]|nr:Ldh family oxidoreductase [bacterium]